MPQAQNALKMYINGVQETSFNTATYPNDTNAYWNEPSAKHSVGCGLNSSGDHYQEFEGYIAEVNFIDGLVLDPTFLVKHLMVRGFQKNTQAHMEMKGFT